MQRSAEQNGNGPEGDLLLEKGEDSSEDEEQPQAKRDSSSALTQQGQDKATETLERRFPIKLVATEGQYLALALGCVALPLVLIAASSPLSCVKVDHTEAMWPNRCMNHTKGLLRLTPFCMKSCMGNQDTVFIWCQGLALSLQMLMLLRNIPGCSGWMSVKASADVQKHLQKAHETVDTFKRKRGWGWSWVKDISRDAVRDVSLALLTYGRRTGAGGCGQQPGVPQEPLTKMSMLCTSLALFQIGVLLCTSWSPYPVQFHCHMNDEPAMHLHYQNDLKTLCLCVVAAVIMMIVLALQVRAQYTRQVKINATIRSVPAFEKLFLVENGRFVKPDISELSQKSKEEELWVNDLKVMQVHRRRLRFVTHGVGWKKRTSGLKEAFEDYKSWEGPVTLHFGMTKPMTLPENRHQIAAWVFTFLAATSLFCASQLCWQCVEKLHLKDGLTIVELQQVFHLAGACGRHSPIGAGSLLGSVMLIGSALVQAFLFFLTNEQFHYGGPVKKALLKAYPQEMRERQLWGCLIPPHGTILDHEVYEDANIEQPKIWCHVWVKVKKDNEDEPATRTPSEKPATHTPSEKPGQDGGKETAEQRVQREMIQDCDEGDEHTLVVQEELDAERETWEKSKLPIQVQLRRPPKEEKKLLCWIRGLLRDEYGPPVLCVVIPKNDFRDLDKQQDFDRLKKRSDENGSTLKCQVVPRQFVAGGLSVWLNLGRKHLWEKLAGALPFGAFLLISCEIVYSMYQDDNLIKTCDDILNADCSFFDNDAQGHLVDFRHALGVKVAMLGGAFALMSCFCQRVWYSKDNSPEVLGCWQRYMEAWGFHIKVLCKMVFTWPCKFICQRCNGATDDIEMKNYEFSDESLHRLLLQEQKEQKNDSS